VFWGFLVVAAALGIVRVHRLRVRHLVRRIAELGAGVAERTVQLRERGDRLAAAAGELSAAQERIDRANQAMLASFDQLRPGIVVAAGDGTVVFASQSAKRLLQLDDSACGRPWTAALPFDDEHRAELLRQVERPAAERQAVYAVYRLESGRRLAIEVEVVDDPRDATARIFCFYDVSDLHELRERTDRAPAPNPPAIAAPPAELHEGNGHGESRLLPEIGPGDERQRVIEALQRAGGNRAEAARLLGIARSTFYRRLKALGLEVQPT
jgi:transcriptional regulator with PAS, ATPase and Fis domain